MSAVSICIPTYRQVDFLQQALDSLVIQRFTDYEVVVTDDSPDGDVEELIRSYDFGGRLRYFRNFRPLGSPRNWDEAVRLSSAPLIKILHHDDQFAHADALGRFVALMEQNPDCAFGFSATQVEDVMTGASWVHSADAAQIADMKRRPERLLLGNVIGAPSATIYRRSLGLDFDPRMRWLVDVDFYMRALRLNPRVAVTEEPLIITPTGARHQVTEAVRDDGALQVREALLMFEKAFDQLSGDPDVALFWWRTLKRYRVRNVKQLARYGEIQPALNAYFRSLFAHPPRDGRRRLADFVPAALRNLWRPVRQGASARKIRS